jgi:hypothetical protein
MRTFLNVLWITAIVVILGYTLIGTSGNVNEIKRRVPEEISQRNWKILRYEGFQYGSWGGHGGKVWYHVCNIDNPNIQYRVNISLWNNELQWYYDSPEILQRIELNTLK